jgi:hypothetical protein
MEGGAYKQDRVGRGIVTKTARVRQR